MRNTAINTLAYTGIVTISQYRGAKKVRIAQMHNTGGMPLFDFLSDCLVGDFDTARAGRPAKIRLLKQKKVPDRDTFITQYEAVSPFIFLLTSPEKKQSSTQSYVRYTFMIPKNTLEEDLANYEDLGIGLYTLGTDNNISSSDALENFAAFVELDDNKAVLINTLANTALVVDWELVISNIGSVSTTAR